MLALGGLVVGLLIGGASQGAGGVLPRAHAGGVGMDPKTEILYTSSQDGKKLYCWKWQDGKLLPRGSSGR